jgi:anti-sigma factor RsiW
MASESDRIARAGDYVFGLMDDRERARAERDLEIDPAFRDAVLRLAERMRAFDPVVSSDGISDNRWNLVAQRLAELPQMRLAGLNEAEAKPAPVMIHRLRRKPYGVGLHSLGGRLGLVIAIALLAAFALGYLAGTL